MSSMKTKTSTQSRRARVKPRRILVPVDFSDSSARALRHAAKRAAESGGSLIIVYVVPADYGWLGIGRDELRDLDRSLQRQAADRLRAFADENVGRKRACGLGSPCRSAGRGNCCGSARIKMRFNHALDARPHRLGSVLDWQRRRSGRTVSTLPGRSRTPGQTFARSKTKAASCIAI